MVIGIIAILAGLLMVGANAVQNRAKRDNTRVLIDRMQTALAQYEADHGHYPGFIGTDPSSKPYRYEALADYLRAQEAVEASEVEEVDINGTTVEAVVDYWGHYVRARPDGNNQPALDIWSVGPDGTNDTDDDVVNWTRDWTRP
jgi:type II secretory pathway pseudopilin PulG